MSGVYGFAFVMMIVVVLVLGYVLEEGIFTL